MSEDLVPPTCIIRYDDGDIILSVNKNHTNYHFRVHSTILRIASPVFRDMLSIPQPTEATPNLDGCPVVALKDSPDDLKAFLDALYWGLAMHQGQKLSLDIALSILLLSDKYSAEGLRQGIIRVIQEDWPLNRVDYLNRQKLMGSPGCRVVQSAKLIKIARICNIPELLPTAFYELAASSSIRTFSAVEISVLEQLSPSDLLCLVEGPKRLVERVRRFSIVLEDLEEDAEFLWNSDPNMSLVDIFKRRSSFPECDGDEQIDDMGTGACICTGIGVSFLEALEKRLGQGGFVMSIVQELQQVDTWDLNACSGCCEWLSYILMSKEDELWENIPVDFGLPKIDPNLYSGSMFGNP